MTAVNFMGTFSKDERENNGLEEIAAKLLTSQDPIIIVGVMVPHAVASHKIGEPEVPVVRHMMIEYVEGDRADTVRKMIEARRDERKVGNMGPLFDADGWVRDTPPDA